ncbi:MAG: T9SS type A sorting domain-containing protein [Cyclobacteriaceae bacterium]|nr:T9SS type A sorting domain-containing protein [Cyclobacteriaceae bacterium]
MDTNMPGNCSHITAVNPKSGIRIFPNPFTKSLFVETDNVLTLNEFEVFDLTGRLVYKTTFSKRFEWGGVNHLGDRLSSGVYLVRINHPDGILTSRVFLNPKSD